jgi:hypothetical protein
MDCLVGSSTMGNAVSLGEIRLLALYWGRSDEVFMAVAACCIAVINAAMRCQIGGRCGGEWGLLFPIQYGWVRIRKAIGFSRVSSDLAGEKGVWWRCFCEGFAVLCLHLKL